LRWCVLKQPLQLVGREYLGRFVYAFNPLDCRNWIDGHVATLHAEIEQTSQRSSEVVDRLRGKPQVQKARNFSGADALDASVAKTRHKPLVPLALVVLVDGGPSESGLFGQKFSDQS